MKYLELYKKINEISPIPFESWKFAEGLFKESFVPKNSRILNAGEKSDRFFINIDGLLRIYYNNDNGQEFTKTFIQKNEIATPYAEMLQKQPSRVSIEALTDTTILTLYEHQFEKLLLNSACWSKLQKKYTEIYYIFREEREYELLALTVKERFESFKKRFPDVFSLIPQYYVASYLGVTPVTLSRALSRK